MRNVDFHVDSVIVLHIRSLNGALIPIHPGPVIFDDKRSFTLHIETADVGMTDADLTRLLNSYVFGYPGAPLKRLRITAIGTQLRQTGTLHKLVDIPFDITATVAVTPDGLVQFHPTTMRILGVNGSGLMRFFHLSLEKMIDVTKAKGVMVRGNDIFLNPTLVLPPPAMTGHLSAVRVEGHELVQTFTSAHSRVPLEPPDKTVPNYMFYRGGTLRFGRLTMTDAELQIVDQSPNTPFDFDLSRYMLQLTAGYSRTLPDGGLMVMMPDLRSIPTPSRRPGH